METKLNRDWMEKVHDQCKLKHGLIVSSDGSIGGLAMLWKEGVVVHAKTYSMFYIDVFMDGGEITGWWYLTGFYGNPETSLRFDSWALLKSSRGTSQLPWLAIGDFNEIIGLSKIEGGGSRPMQQMARLSNAVDWCGFKDLGFWSKV